jgi:A/G-specific adenine glycosylase
VRQSPQPPQPQSTPQPTSRPAFFDAPSTPPQQEAQPRQARADADFAARLIAWQRHYGRRALPWQNTRDPYRVWLSEIMLQQTQVATVQGYYTRFLARFPDVAALAAASEDAVLGLWSGLGYYSRARNLLRCAREVMTRFDGAFPRTAVQLATLPGIGRSTAAAIAVFCFGERVAILDGNVKRVLARAFAFDADLARAVNERSLWNRATALLPPADDPAALIDYTQGLMDLGAMRCTPRQPHCAGCPLRAGCRALAQGDPLRYPVRKRTLRRGAESLWMLLARDEHARVWLEKRPARGIWAGLHCLPVFDARAALIQALPPAIAARASDHAPFVHALTHKDLHLHPVQIEVDTGAFVQPASHGAWYDASAWSALGLPAPVRRLLEKG